MKALLFVRLNQPLTATARGAVMLVERFCPARIARVIVPADRRGVARVVVNGLGS